MHQTEILQLAVDITSGDRERDYGDAVENMHDIAKAWSWYLRRHIEPRDVAVMMVLTKFARSRTSPQHADHWVDAAAYSAIAGRCALAATDNGPTPDFGPFGPCAPVPGQ